MEDPSLKQLSAITSKYGMIAEWVPRKDSIISKLDASSVKNLQKFLNEIGKTVGARPSSNLEKWEVSIANYFKNIAKELYRLK